MFDRDCRQLKTKHHHPLTKAAAASAVHSSQKRAVNAAGWCESESGSESGLRVGGTGRIVTQEEESLIFTGSRGPGQVTRGSCQQQTSFAGQLRARLAATGTGHAGWRRRGATQSGPVPFYPRSWVRLRRLDCTTCTSQ
ncbi:hypothetical protein NDU88_001789, partial [Pleurodeles waltl]